MSQTCVFFCVCESVKERERERNREDFSKVYICFKPLQNGLFLSTITVFLLILLLRPFISLLYKEIKSIRVKILKHSRSEIHIFAGTCWVYLNGDAGSRLSTSISFRIWFVDLLFGSNRYSVQRHCLIEVTYLVVLVLDVCVTVSLHQEQGSQSERLFRCGCLFSTFIQQL